MAGEFLQHAEPHGCVTCLMPACMLLLEASLEQVPTHPTAPELSGQEMGGMDLPSITSLSSLGQQSLSSRPPGSPVRTVSSRKAVSLSCPLWWHLVISGGAAEWLFSCWPW